MNITSTHTWRRKSFLPGRIAALAAVATLLSASPALAQLGAMGGGSLGAAPVRGSDTGYDPVNNVYLVVGGTGGDLETPLYGVFVSASSGAMLGSPFQIKNPGAHAYFPRVAYSPHVNNGNGGFLVAWQGGDWKNYVHVRIVAYPQGVISGETILPSDDPTHQEMGPAIAYSLSSQVFMVVWATGDWKVLGALVDTQGNLAGGPFQITAPGESGRDPSIAWNLYTNEFGVLYSGWNASGATVSFARVTPSGTILRRHTFHGAPTTFITDLGFNPVTGRFVGAWFQGGVYGAELDANGDVLALGLVSTGTGSRDGLGLSYNPVSGTFLLVGQGNSWNIWGAELNARGARMSADTELSWGGTDPGSFHPRAGANTNAKQWGFSYSDYLGVLAHFRVQTTSSDGGTTTSLGSGGSTPPPTSSPGGCPGTAPFPGAVCVNGGWVPGSSGGSGDPGGSGGCPGTAPFPGAVCQNGGWVPGGSGGSGSPGGSGGCTTPDPFALIGGGTCVNGGWVPGGSGGSGSSGGSGGCPGTAPFPGAVCVNGGWVPGGSGGSGDSGGSGGCPGTAPFPGAVCVNGGWVPGGSGGSGSSGGSGGCPGTAPFPGAVCVNGGWVPGGSGGSGSSGGSGGCPGTAPFPGAVCVNGGWVPGSSGGSGGCTTPDPFASMGGGTCINGGWVPGSSSSSSGSGGCTTPDPFVALGGGICVNGGWTLAGSGGGGSSTCTTPDPFVAIGGGVCIAGGWVPKG